MSNSFTQTENQGFFSRLMSSFFGILIGFALIPGSVALISWNEYRTVHRTQGLMQAEKEVIHLDSPLELKKELDQRLVHLSGMAETPEVLKDRDFDVSQAALRLERKVEMYQWVEHKSSRTRDKLGGGKETITTYDYRKEWHADRINSESFKRSEGHSNPELRFSSTSLVTDAATVGPFNLKQSLVGQLNQWTDVNLNESVVPKDLLASTGLAHSIDGNVLYFGKENIDKSNPKVGDLKVRFQAVEPMKVSLIAKQSGQGFESYKTANGESIESIEAGERSATEMFDDLKFSNTSTAMAFRFAGWLLACIGFTMIAGPLHVLANIVPLFGRMVGAVTTFVGFLLGSIVALITISIAWIVVRPLFSISLLAIAAIGIFMMFRRKKKEEIPTLQEELPIAQLAE